MPPVFSIHRRREIVWPYSVDVMLRKLRNFLFRLRFSLPVPLSFLDSPRASNADPFSCLLAFRASRLFSFMAERDRDLARADSAQQSYIGVTYRLPRALMLCRAVRSRQPMTVSGFFFLGLVALATSCSGA